MKSKRKPIKLLHKEPLIVPLRQNTEEEKSGKELRVVQKHLERMKRGGGIKGLDDKSSGIEILMAETFAKINPTDPLIIS